MLYVWTCELRRGLTQIRNYRAITALQILSWCTFACSGEEVIDVLSKENRAYISVALFSMHVQCYKLLMFRSSASADVLIIHIDV